MSVMRASTVPVFIPFVNIEKRYVNYIDETKLLKALKILEIFRNVSNKLS